MLKPLVLLSAGCCVPKEPKSGVFLAIRLTPDTIQNLKFKMARTDSIGNYRDLHR
jgi:hypothetical protein